MIPKIKIRCRIISSISKRGLLLTLASVLFITSITIAFVYHFIPPDNLIMTTGYEGGNYAKYGERYRQILARENINIKLLPSSGSVENLNRLSDESSRVDVGFIQDGMSS